LPKKTKRKSLQNKNNFESIKFLFSLSSTTSREEKKNGFLSFAPKTLHVTLQGFH